MGRWEPNARGRLEQAALELFSERGFDQTTAAEIAARAGLAPRTFFRYFADKREVLFGGAGELQALLVRGVADAPEGPAPLDLVVGAVESLDALFEPRRAMSRQRQNAILSNVELLERELIKLATLAAALAEVLRARGVAEPAASLAAEAGITVFKIAFQRWIEPGNQAPFAQVVRDCLADLKTVTAGR
jgi:AcrR family transcriptional regulator